jgi:hypothetical protein
MALYQSPAEEAAQLFDSISVQLVRSPATTQNIAMSSYSTRSGRVHATYSSQSIRCCTYGANRARESSTARQATSCPSSSSCMFWNASTPIRNCHPLPRFQSPLKHVIKAHHPPLYNIRSTPLLSSFIPHQHWSYRLSHTKPIPWERRRTMFAFPMTQATIGGAAAPGGSPGGVEYIHRTRMTKRCSPTTLTTTLSTPATDFNHELRRTRWEPAVSFARNMIPVHRTTS